MVAKKVIHSAKVVHKKKKKKEVHSVVLICQAGFNGPSTLLSSSSWIFGHYSQMSQVPSNSSKIQAITSSSQD